MDDIVTSQNTRDHLRGTTVGRNGWRNFCMVCGKPLLVHTLALSKRRDIDCVDCRQPTQEEAERTARGERCGE